MNNQLVDEWKKRDPFLQDMDGFIKFVEARAKAENLLRLIRLGHPDSHGEPFSRLDVIRMIEECGMKILEDLGWPTDLDSHYKNLHSYSVETLGEILTEFHDQEHRPNEPLEYWLFTVLEDYEPTDQTETVYPSLTDEDEVYAIKVAVGHVADNFIPRMAKMLFEKHGRQEAIKFLRQQLSSFGTGRPRKPSVDGTPKGVIVGYGVTALCGREEGEFRLIRWSRILDYILECC